MQVVPSILEKNPQDLFYQINRLSPYFSRFQIDIADGIFVPNKTVQIEEIKDSLNKDSYFDFHLMVKNYEDHIKKINGLKNIINIKNVFIHFDLLPNYQLLTTNYTLPIGLTINPQDQIDDLAYRYDIKQISSIQIMSVTPGAQGNPFLPETLNKIEQLRDIGYRKDIFLDGAINEKTISVILSKKYKPDFICPGSYLTKTKTLKENVEYLSKLL
jgi:pentose-5-phosphate-3-epimerase